MTLLDAAECHVRDCVLLETEYEGTKQGNSRPGTGPSLMQRRARETAIQKRRAARLGEELLREDISIAELEPQRLGRKVDPACSHRADKPKKRNTSGTSRFRSVRSAHFLSRLQKANQDKGSIKLRKVLSRSDVSSLFEVQGSDGERRYEVEVSAAPSCTCEDYKKFNGQELCKHVIWVYLSSTTSLPLTISEAEWNESSLSYQRIKGKISNLCGICYTRKESQGKIHTARP